jgi:predicted regulator of amino acid metabolism with ACT domain
MSQPSLSKKYIFDTSSFLSQKDNEPHRRRLYKRLWENIDELIHQGCIVTCSEVKEEIKDEDIKEWFIGINCEVLDINEAVQKNVIKVVTTKPELIDFKQIKSSGDAFIIATAMEYGLIVVTEENKDSPKKIPQVCEALGIKSIDINGLCEEEGWEF